MERSAIFKDPWKVGFYSLKISFVECVLSGFEVKF